MIRRSLHWLWNDGIGTPDSVAADAVALIVLGFAAWLGIANVVAAFAVWLVIDFSLSLWRILR